MATKLKGTVTQYGSKGYGFIHGDDGKKYFVHQKNIANKSHLNTNTRVVFNPRDSAKGAAAINVKLEKSATKLPLTDFHIKMMFLSLLALQIITAYYVFLSPISK